MSIHPLKAEDADIEKAMADAIDEATSGDPAADIFEDERIRLNADIARLERALKNQEDIRVNAEDRLRHIAAEYQRLEDQRVCAVVRGDGFRKALRVRRQALIDID